MTLIEELKALDLASDKHDNLYARVLAYIEDKDDEIARLSDIITEYEDEAEDAHLEAKEERND